MLFGFTDFDLLCVTFKLSYIMISWIPHPLPVSYALVTSSSVPPPAPPHPVELIGTVLALRLSDGEEWIHGLLFSPKKKKIS